MTKRQKAALLLFLLCLPGRVFFSEQQTVIPSSWPSENFPPSSSDSAISQMLLNPLFIAHLLVLTILFVLFVVVFLDLMLKAVFYGCAYSVHCCTAALQLKRNCLPVKDHNRRTMIDVFIQGGTNSPQCITLDGLSHGQTLYSIIEELHKVPVNLQLLLFAGKAVKREVALSSQGIKHGSTIFFGVKGIGGSGNDKNEILEECVSCGEHAVYFCKECEAVRCQVCNEMWHKHRLRRNHSIEVVSTKTDTTVSTNDDVMETNSGVDAHDDSFSFNEEDEFDSLAGTVDVNEATKTYLLAEKFGNTRFRDFQRESIDAALNKKNCLVIQPTGKGKSLCYQFPALYTGKTTLVITPTISLMHDQTRELVSRGIDAVFLGSAQPDRTADVRAFDEKNPASIIFVSPEWLFSKPENMDRVKVLYESGKLGLIAIDEAHLIYEWDGFREHYQKCETIPQLFDGIPVMALTATATPEVYHKLSTFLNNPVVVRSSVNRSNIFLAVHQCSFKKSEGPSKSFSLDHRDFNEFADQVATMVKNECSIIYTDFATHVGPIVLALRDRGVKAIGYYGKMKESEKCDAYIRWKTGEVPVIVATRAFGLGINKENVRFVIRNGLPPSISAWAQELGRAGRDGKHAEAHIFYCDEDIHHVGFWSGDLARRNRTSEISDTSRNFSEAMQFCYSHLSGLCRRKALLRLFGEKEEDAVSTDKCCDICEQGLVQMENRSAELKLLIVAINELGNKGEVKITEWIRGGQLTWMKDVQPKECSAYGKSPKGLSKSWWRNFIRQTAAAGYITRSIKTAKFGQSNGVYASLSPSDKGIKAAKEDSPVMLPVFSDEISHCSSAPSVASKKIPTDHQDEDLQDPSVRKRKGRGCHLLPLVKKLLESKENWRDIEDKENYQFLGTFSFPAKNILWYIEDVTKLAHYTPSNPDFLWSDVQFSKNSSTKQLIEVDVGKGVQKMWFHRAQCKGVKRCKECDHTVCNSTIRNTCQEHTDSPLIQVTDCDVEFVYVRPEDTSDNRRWIGGLLRKHNFQAMNNFHSHKTIASHRIPQKVRAEVSSAVVANPSLTTSQISNGQGIDYRPSAADLSAAHQGRLNSIRKRALKSTGLNSKDRKGYMMLLEMENLADTIDSADREVEGSSRVSDEYKLRGRPYMRKYAITSSLVYQLIMSPLMSSILAKAEYIEVDTTYNENTDLPYLWNVTAFDYNVMRWVAVARVRSNKEDSEFYSSAFQAVFGQCKEDHKEFVLGSTLKGVVLDWSDTERKGLELAIGKDLSEKLLIGCQVHYGRSYQRVADRVNNLLPRQIRQVSRAAFCKVARAIPHQKERSEVMKLFNALKGAVDLSELQHVTLTEEILANWKQIATAWKEATHWVEWWTRLPHLCMLCEAFKGSPSHKSTLEKAPKDTNGVERVNQDSKQSSPTCLRMAMEYVYKKDKCLALSYIAAEKQCSLTYREKTEESRRSCAAKRKIQRSRLIDTDDKAQFGPPDKRSNFSGNCTSKETVPVKVQKKRIHYVDSSDSDSDADELPKNKKALVFSGIGQRVEVKYDDGVWYKGTLINFDVSSGHWVVEFDEDDEKTFVKFPDEDVRLI